MAGSVNPPPFERLYSNYLSDRETLCWEWQGQRGSSGYGLIKVFGKLVSTHRLSYELYKGPIPNGLEILHACDNKICINPDHLQVGSRAENMRDAGIRGRMSSGNNHWTRTHDRSIGFPNKLCNPVRVMGKVYRSQKRAETVLGLGRGTVRHWLRSRPEKAVVISREEYEKHA
jgi:hypothetical protein